MYDSLSALGGITPQRQSLGGLSRYNDVAQAAAAAMPSLSSLSDPYSATFGRGFGGGFQSFEPQPFSNPMQPMARAPMAPPRAPMGPPPPTMSAPGTPTPELMTSPGFPTPPELSGAPGFPTPPEQTYGSHVMPPPGMASAPGFPVMPETAPGYQTPMLAGVHGYQVKPGSFF